MRIRFFLRFLSIFLLLLPFSSCQKKPDRTIKVAASSTPHAEMLELIQQDMEERGYRLEILVVDDYHLPNRLLAEKQVDANFFQHLPFLESEIEEFGYKLVPLAKIHLEPLRIYSKKYQSLKEVCPKAVVTLPSDPSNEARALKLLEKAALIKLKEGIGRFPTILDISENPLCLNFKELDAPLLPRTLADADISLIPGNFVLQADIDPTKALFSEESDSPYANILVIRQGEEGREELQLLANLLRSQKIINFIKERHSNLFLLL